MAPNYISIDMSESYTPNSPIPLVICNHPASPFYRTISFRCSGIVRRVGVLKITIFPFLGGIYVVFYGARFRAIMIQCTLTKLCRPTVSIYRI